MFQGFERDSLGGTTHARQSLGRKSKIWSQIKDLVANQSLGRKSKICSAEVAPSGQPASAEPAPSGQPASAEVGRFQRPPRSSHEIHEKGDRGGRICRLGVNFGCGCLILFNREPQIKDLLSNSGLQPSFESHFSCVRVLSQADACKSNGL